MLRWGDAKKKKKKRSVQLHLSRRGKSHDAAPTAAHNSRAAQSE